VKVLILTQYYPPESGAPQNRLADLARRLHERGHAVTVLTAMPNYPKGEIFAGYRGRLRCTEMREGVRVVRTWIYPSRAASPWKRLANYLSFCITSVVLGYWGLGKVHVVLTESPPLFAGIGGYLVSRLKRACFVFNVSDLWPASVVSLGVVSNHHVIRLARRLEEFLYRHADLVTGQTQGIVNDIRGRSLARSVQLLTNGVDLERFSPGCRDAALRRAWGADDKFVVGYAGNIGLAQNLETLLRAAERLSGDMRIKFVVVGDGADRLRIEGLLDALALKNLFLLPLLPRERIPALLASFDAAVVPLRRLELFRGALPSKMFEAMGCAVPVILSAEGEAAALIERSGGGVCVAPEDHGALSDAIVTLAGDRERARRMGEAGRRYVEKHYDRQDIAASFAAMIERLVGGEGAVA
jgi:glycosyltransferase involved in cell wall biosynthesis